MVTCAASPPLSNSDQLESRSFGSFSVAAVGHMGLAIPGHKSRRKGPRAKSEVEQEQPARLRWKCVDMHTRRETRWRWIVDSLRLWRQSLALATVSFSEVRIAWPNND
jgi:hypothetical protein